MYRRAGNAFRPQLRRLHTRASAAPRSSKIALGAAGVAAVGSTLWYNTQRVHGDAELVDVVWMEAPPAILTSLVKKLLDPDRLQTVVWGLNNNGTLLPGTNVGETLREPVSVPCFEDVALRDMRLHKSHAACVDVNGDVYQWGRGFYGSAAATHHVPKLTLKGKDIVQLQLTESKIYALSSSGVIYTLSSKESRQALAPGEHPIETKSALSSLALWKSADKVDFVELQPSSALGWGERFTSIAAGDQHLLALTSKGRVFAHPVGTKANTYGQLGFRRFDVPDPKAAIKQDVHLHLDLVPKNVADPYGNAARSSRNGSPNFGTGVDYSDLDDTSIRFCPKIFEMPALQGIPAAQIAAGARTSFIRTKDGRVLAWGANQYGQLGLGSKVTVEAVTVPTEVAVWRFYPDNAEAKCTSIAAGGDLAAFVVERTTKDSITLTDVLMCGNGQYGGLGNNHYTTAQGTPMGLKAISGLQQCKYNDRSKRLDPIVPEEIRVSPTGHVLAALNSNAGSGGVGGRDLMVWGRNYDSELGSGKKGSVAVPRTLELDGERFMLMSRKAKVVKDPNGNVVKKNVQVDQNAVVGYESSSVYWRIK